MTNVNTNETSTQQANQPDFIAKKATGHSKKQRLERVGVAWQRDDGGICLRLVGTQIIDDDIYIYPNTNGDDA